jgi:ribosome production factor 1
MFQTLFPRLPEFEGRQVVTLHNQRDFLFFRRHRYVLRVISDDKKSTVSRYAFRSTEKTALQEIGPRFTLRLRWLKKNIPAVHNLGAQPPPLKLASEEEGAKDEEDKRKVIVPPTTDEYEWQWRVSHSIIVSLSPADCMFSLIWRLIDGRSSFD